MQEELAQVYREAIALTEKQAEAIAKEDWELLGALLMKRDRLITRAEALIHEGSLPEDRQELRALLTQLRVKDQVNQTVITRKVEEIKVEIQSLQQSNSAVTGYLDNLRGVAESHFIDHDQ
ncbi:Flagellar protein FliT [compost metagenome]